MTEVLDVSAGGINEPRPMIPGPGARLREARQARNMSVADIKSALRFRDGIVEALEQDDYNGLPAPIFVKGYLRSYARLVGVGEEPVLAQYRAQDASESPPLEPACAKTSLLQQRVTWPVVAGVLGVFVVIIAVFFIKGTGDELDGQVQAVVEEQTLPVESRVVEEPAGASRPIVTDMVAEEMTTMPALLDSDEVLAEAEMILRYKPEVLVEVPALVEEAPVEVMLESVIRLSFEENCWTELRDRDGHRLIFALQRAGTTREVAGMSPFTILLGNADGVQVSYNGERYDFRQHVRRNVARFELGSSE